MAWFKVDDGFWSHPKTLALSADAVALWVRAGAYSCQHLTDGVIHEPVLRLLGSGDAAVELQEAGLWLSMPGGYKFHDWDEYQETSETVKKRRSDARERQRRAREARENKRMESQRESRVTDSVSDGVSSLPPTRPDPTRPDPPTSNEVGEGTGDTSPPSPFCKRHEATEGSDHPCRGCKQAAKRYDEWEAAASAEAVKAAKASQPRRVCAHGMPVSADCPGCEETS